MPEQYFFDIPIYWRDEARFNTEYTNALKKHLADFERPTGYPLTENLRISLTEGFWKSYVAPWRFNQVVGWLRLYKLGSQLRGELWYMNAKRPGRQLVNKQFSDKGKAFELHVFPTETTADINQNLESEIARFGKTLRKGHTLDTDAFLNMARFVNWRRFVDS